MLTCVMAIGTVCYNRFNLSLDLTTLSKGLGAHQVSYHSANFGGHRNSGGGYNGFHLSRDFTRPRDKSVK